MMRTMFLVQNSHPRAASDEQTPQGGPTPAPLVPRLVERHHKEDVTVCIGQLKLTTVSGLV
jgi:hypothetical protein